MKSLRLTPLIMNIPGSKTLSLFLEGNKTKRSISENSLEKVELQSDRRRGKSLSSGLIMPPRVMTRSVGRPAAESLGGVTGVRVGRGGRDRRPRENGNVVNENVEENVRNVIVNGNLIGCSYKEFLACIPKEYDGKGGAVVLTRWIDKMEFVLDMSGCSIDQKVKYTAGSFVGKALTCHEMQKLESELWNHAMVGAGYAAYTDRFHELARLVLHLVTPESRMIERREILWVLAQVYHCNSLLCTQRAVSHMLHRKNRPGHLARDVTDIAQKDKNEAKQTKPSTGMERVREIKAEDEFILRLGLIDEERPRRLEGSPLPYKRRPPHTD
ncbi:hypothetical protein Tco_0401061 [Tanacetum coccineum]